MVRQRGIKNSFFTQLKLMFICFLFLSISMINIINIDEGFFIIDEVNSISINEGEPGTVLCIKDDLLYVGLVNNSEEQGYSNILQIIDVHQPENPIVVGRYELGFLEFLCDFKISGNIAYMITWLAYFIGQYCSVELLDITDPTNPVRIGSSPAEAIKTYRVNNTDRIGVYKNYTYVSGDAFLIFDCSNQTLPMRVGSFPSPLVDVHIENDYLYLVSNGVTIYSLADPANPVFLGAVESTKGFSVRSGVYGNYIISAFQDVGIQVYDCTDPTQPVICKDYDLLKWKIGAKGIVHDIEIVEDRLFAGGDKLYIFNIRNPQKLRRIARINIGDQNISQIIVANNYIYLTIDSNIRIYSYVENSLLWNIGLGSGVGLSILLGTSILIVLVKRRKQTV
ncbi:MAG: LVIVD repeat-containing protein [Candidatus Heimdallarchaeota archaeon]